MEENKDKINETAAKTVKRASRLGFLKDGAAGFGMGVAFIIPGFSGGSIAAILGIYGFAAGLLFGCLLIATNKTLLGKGYLYPLIPFNFKAFTRLIFRVKKNDFRSKKRKYKEI